MVCFLNWVVLTCHISLIKITEFDTDFMCFFALSQASVKSLLKNSIEQGTDGSLL
jgi:hypothetical protein